MTVPDEHESASEIGRSPGSSSRMSGRAGAGNGTGVPVGVAVRRVRLAPGPFPVHAATARRPVCGLAARADCARSIIWNVHGLPRGALPFRACLPSPPGPTVAPALIVGIVLGGCFVAAVFGIAFLTLETPLASSRTPRPGPDQLRHWAPVPSPGGALLVATNCLAGVAAKVRGSRRPSPPAAAPTACRRRTALRGPTEGRPIPHIVVGRSASRHPRARRLRIRQVGRRGTGDHEAGCRLSIRSGSRSERRQRAPRLNCGDLTRRPRPRARSHPDPSIRSPLGGHHRDRIPTDRRRYSQPADRGPKLADRPRVRAAVSTERHAETGSLVGMGSSPVG